MSVVAFDVSCPEVMDGIPCVDGSVSYLWTSEFASDRFTAAGLCVSCPRIAQCFQDAERNNEQFGIWASYDREVKALPGRPRSCVPRCGTSAGFLEHLKRNESPCVACRSARNREHENGDRPPPRNRHTKPRPHEPCGTNAGASRHRYNNEELCEPCRVANNEYKRNQRKDKPL